MNLKTQLYITLAMFAALLLVMGLLLLTTTRRVAHLNRQIGLTRQVENLAQDLSYFSNDYLLHSGSEQYDQWQGAFTNLTDNLSLLELTYPDHLALQEQIKSGMAKLKTTLDAAGSALMVDDPAEQFTAARSSWSEIKVQNQEIVGSSTLLSQQLEDRVDKTLRDNQNLMLTLVALVGGAMLLHFVYISRRIFDSLAELKSGAQAVGAGNLEYTLSEDQPDELGDLARSFNRMTVNLREMTATKLELEQEIAERRRAEELIKAYAEKLERSNRELEDFAFVASHDLQEPLRKIDKFGQLLRSSQTLALGEKEQEYLERMQKSAQRMQSMIEGLLILSRVTTRGKPFELVDLNEAVQAVLEDLEVRLLLSEGRVEVDQMPLIYADPTQLHLLLQNLISNALKFHKPGIPPVVRVSANRCTDQEVEIVVEDEGIGFQMIYADRIFQPFQRLHGRSSYEGSGIGLSICRKIVERHGGSITVTSEPGQGSRFVARLSSQDKAFDRNPTVPLGSAVRE